MLNAMTLLKIHRIHALAVKDQAFALAVNSLANEFVRQTTKSTVERVVIFADEIDLHDDIKRLIGSDDNVDYIVSALGPNSGFAFCETFRATAHLAIRPTFLGIEWQDPRDDWLYAMKDAKHFNCTLEELRAALNGSIFVVFANVNFFTDQESLQRPRHDDMTLERIKQLVFSSFLAMTNNGNSTRKPTGYSFFAYDAAIALFTALYRTDVYMESAHDIRLVDLKQHTLPHTWAMFAAKFREEMLATEFVGATALASEVSKVHVGCDQNFRGRSGTLPVDIISSRMSLPQAGLRQI